LLKAIAKWRNRIYLTSHAAVVGTEFVVLALAELDTLSLRLPFEVER
jgi:hypothetical protein